MTDLLSRTLLVNGKNIEADAGGYLKNLNDWSEDFARPRAAARPGTDR